MERKSWIIWLSALVVGTLIGLSGIGWINDFCEFIASVYTRLFQFLAMPTIALAVITTLASFGSQQDTGRIFRRTITFTLLTTLAASVVGLLLYLIIRPDNLPASMLAASAADSTLSSMKPETSVYDHILDVVPNNLLTPFLNGNVLAILLVAVAVGLGIAKMPESEKKTIVKRGIEGLQDLLFILIRALIWTLPVGITAFAAQLAAAPLADMGGAIGKYVAVIIGGNVVQFFIVLPLFLLARGLNPLKVLKAMSPAVMMALFTKSSAATLPVTMQSAEERLGVSPRVSRFVLPICTTINMNGCAAFILVTSLFVMQNGGILSFDGGVVALLPTLLIWLLISVISAIGNAGVPMGCFFLTVSLMTGIGAPVGVMGLILPLYTIIDMVETAENVWSDSCVCAMTDKSVR